MESEKGVIDLGSQSLTEIEALTDRQLLSSLIAKGIPHRKARILVRNLRMAPADQVPKSPNEIALAEIEALEHPCPLSIKDEKYPSCSANTIHLSLLRVGFSQQEAKTLGLRLAKLTIGGCR